MQCRQKWNLGLSDDIQGERNGKSMMSERVGPRIAVCICRRWGLGAHVEDEVWRTTNNQGGQRKKLKLAEQRDQDKHVKSIR